MVNDLVFNLGQAMIYLGFAGAVGAQVFVCAKLLRDDMPRAVAALVVPFYLIYYVWYSERRMPRVKNVWVWGLSCFVLGFFVMSLGLDL